MTADLGTATLNLDVNIRPLEQGQQSVQRAAKRIDDDLEKVAAFAKRATETLHGIQMRAEQALESGRVSDKIKRALSEIGYEAAHARADLERVKLDQGNASETEAAGDRIDRKLKDVTGNANEARRALEGARLAGIGAGGGGGGRIPVDSRNPGSGFGPFGSGFGRVGLLGTAVGGAALLGPAAGPGALGLLAAIPTLATAGAGALGTLALGFVGVGKAIGGDLKAFKALQPAQQQFVLTVRSLKGWVDQLREVAGESMFPGLTKGLKEALSPGLLGIITHAVQSFGKAIGDAGEQWGRYFGSARFLNIFEPLMQTGVGLLTKMSGAALDLFDALGVLGRGAIPLVNWLTDAAASGARFVDTFVRATDASGALGGAMGEAQQSLRLVAGLGESLVRVVGALGQALYPVSRIAVADLTDGLNALAGMITRNRDKIAEIVGGALAALKSTVETVTPLLTGMAKGLDAVAEAIGGWKVAFELVIGGYLASKMFDLATSFGAVGTAAGESGAAMGVGQLASRLDALKRIGPIAIGVTIGLELIDNSDYKRLQDRVQKALGPLGFLGDNIKDALAIGPRKAKHLVDIWNGTPSGKSSSTPAAFASRSTVNVPFLFAQITGGRLGVAGVERLRGQLSESDYDALLAHAKTKVTGRTYGLVGMNRPELYIPEYAGDYEVPVPDYNSRPPFTKNLGPKPHHPKPSLLDIVFPQRMQASLSDARANAAGGSMGSLQRLLAVAKKSLDYLDAEHRTGKKLVVLNRERATIAALIERTEQSIFRLQIAIPQGMQNALANAKAALGSTSSSPLSAESLNARAAALAKIVTVEDRILDRLKQQHVTGKALAALQKEIGQNETARAKALGQLATTATNAGTATMAERILGIAGQTGQGAQLSSLRTRERGILTKALGKAGVQRGSFRDLSLDQLLERAHGVLGVGLPNSVYQSLLKVNKAFEKGLHGMIGDKAIENIRQRFSQITQTLQEGFDGFNLTVAEQKRHFLDARFADVYHGRAGATADAKAPAVYAPTFHSTDPAAMERKARADYFRFRLQMAG